MVNHGKGYHGYGEIEKKEGPVPCMGKPLTNIKPKVTENMGERDAHCVVGGCGRAHRHKPLKATYFLMPWSS